MEEQELKPCPFCEGEAVYYKKCTCMSDTHGHYVKCTVCGAETGAVNKISKEAAIEAWNTRIQS